MAINKKDLIRYAAFGNGHILASIGMPGEIGYNSDLKTYDFDPQKAKEILRKNKWPDDFKLKMLVVDQAGREAKIIAKNLNDAGIRTELTILPIAKTYKLIQKGELHNFDIHANMAPDPISHISFLSGVCFHSKSPMSGLNSTAFDEQYNNLTEAETEDRQIELGQELDKFIHEQALALFTYQRIRTYGLDKKLIISPDNTGMMNLKTAIYE